MVALTGAGTSESVWAQLALPALDLSTITSTRVVVVAPHPDDEVLGAGGTTARLHAAGLDVLILAVTDGEASHPARREELQALRPSETGAALAALDLGAATVQRLGQPDGGVIRARLADALRGVLRAGDLVLAPWSGEGHPDHDAVGVVAREVCAELALDLWCYLVWTWHWARPDSDEVPWSSAFRIDLPPALQAMKAAAVECFASQTTGPEPILSGPVLARFARPYEVFLRP